MIIRERPGVLHLLFAVRGSVLPHIALPVFALMGISAAMVWFDHAVLQLRHSNATPFAVFGVGLSLFLGFRNNAAYDRWWEARRLWGGLLADMRSLGREAEIYISDVALRHDLLRQARAFAHLHRINLRGLPRDAACNAAVAATGKDLDGPHPPSTALDRIGTDIAAARATGQLDGFGSLALSNRIASIALAQAGCERIAGTPLPYVYSLLIFRTSYLYCLLIPLALIDTAGWMTPVFVGIVAYVFFGLAEVTEELAHPFGSTLNALPLDAICRAMEISLAPHLGEPAPAPLRPVNYLLT